MEGILSFDFSILNWIQDTLRCGFMDVLMAVFSYLGEWGAVWIVLGVAMLFPKKTRATGAILLAALILCTLVGEVTIKNIVARPRPFSFNDFPLIIKAPSGYSFPSVHSCIAFSSAVILLVRDRRFGIPALFLAALIAFSRLYNYVHFPTDVFCGIILGIICAVVTLFVFKKTGLTEKLSKN